MDINVIKKRYEILAQKHHKETKSNKTIFTKVLIATLVFEGGDEFRLYMDNSFELYTIWLSTYEILNNIVDSKKMKHTESSMLKKVLKDGWGSKTDLPKSLPYTPTEIRENITKAAIYFNALENDDYLIISNNVRGI